MPTSVFSFSVSGNYPVTSTTSGLTFTLSGAAVPSDATIQSVVFSANRVNHYSTMRQFKIRSGATDMCDFRTGSASDGSQIALSIPFSGQNLYTSGSISIAFVGNRGSASADGEVINIRDGCLLQIAVSYEEYTPPVGNPPQEPAIGAPVAGTVIYTAQPRVLVTLGVDPNNLTQMINMAGYTPSRSGYLAGGAKLVMRRASALTTGGTQNLSATSTNTGGYSSPAVTRSFTYTIPTFSQATLTQNQTFVRAIDITELRAMVANIAAYYGLTAPSWGSTLIAGQTSLGAWTSHVMAIRQAIDAIVAHVNGWDTVGTSNKIAVPTWLTIPENRPRVDVMNQLRSVIATL